MQLFKKRPPLKLRVDQPGDIELRPYNRETDYQAVIDVIESRYPEAKTTLLLDEIDCDLTDVDKYWREPGGEFMVLTRNDKVIGSLCVKPIKEHRGFAEFDRFFLSRKEEGKGLGLKLLKWGFQWCQQHNIRTIEMWSNEHRKTSHKLYRKLGFKENGVKKLYRTQPEELYLYYFELDLSDANVLKGLQEMTQSINF